METRDRRHWDYRNFENRSETIKEVWFCRVTNVLEIYYKDGRQIRYFQVFTRFWDTLVAPKTNVDWYVRKNIEKHYKSEKI